MRCKLFSITLNIRRDFTFKHSGRQWSGVPVIAANMDSVGSFAMAKALAEHGVMTAVLPHYQHIPLEPGIALCAPLSEAATSKNRHQSR